MSERVSWFLIEGGWEVVDRTRTVVGHVSRVVGDADADIFDGLRLELEGGAELYVPADRVADIVEGRVELDAHVAELEEAPAAEEPGGVELRRDREAEL